MSRATLQQRRGDDEDAVLIFLDNPEICCIFPESDDDEDAVLISCKEYRYCTEIGLSPPTSPPRVSKQRKLKADTLCKKCPAILRIVGLPEKTYIEGRVSTPIRT